MAAAQFWYPECGGQSLRRTHPHRRDHLAPTTSRCVGLLDRGLHGSDQQRPSALSLAADFSPALGSVAFAPGVRLPVENIRSCRGIVQSVTLHTPDLAFQALRFENLQGSVLK